MSDLAMVGAFLGLVVAVVAPRRNRRTGRLVYWSGTTIACIFVFLMAYPPDWRSGIWMSLFAAGAMVFVAYANTPFLKVRGRIYAFSTNDRRPDGTDLASRDGAVLNVSEPYGGGVSTVKSWWRAFFVVALLAFGVVTYYARGGSPWLAVSAAVIIGVIALVFGHRDAVLENSVASGQRTQFVLTSIVTIGAFTVLYLGAYHLARLRRKREGRHS